MEYRISTPGRQNRRPSGRNDKLGVLFSVGKRKLGEAGFSRDVHLIQITLGQFPAN